MSTPESRLRIEDYGLIGDCTTAALVGRNASIDWLCWPRFDRSTCFAALLGDSNHGRWSLCPVESEFKTSRRYRGETMLLETEFETPSGRFAVIDFMPMNGSPSSVIRIVEGRRGEVAVCMHLTLRFDYGSAVPWVTKLEDGSGISAIAGPHRVALRTPVPLKGEDLSTVAQFTVKNGERIPFVLTYGRSYGPVPPPIGAEAAARDTEKFWRDWAGRCRYHGARREAVVRSLLTLKAMTDSRTGGIIAAPTTSLPEQIGGRRNWDYRYCWIRDATLTLTALMGAGYYEEAKAWREWLRRSVAGTPDALQIMYGVAGERRLAEWEVTWLPGYENSAPVRVGNAASGQLQLDVWGEMADALHIARQGGLSLLNAGWDIQLSALQHLEQIWREPDDGVWEMRGGRRQFTHSKVMAWVAFDRAIKDAEACGFDAPLEHWRGVREEIHREVCQRGFCTAKNSFSQTYDDKELDASLLMIPSVGFLPVEDARVAGTIKAIERELLIDGLVMRYRSESGKDGLPPGEGVFLACSFWLADAWQRQGREAEANEMVDRLLNLRNDLGLLSEEYDTRQKRMLGNFPQGFSHLSLVQTVLGLHEEAPLRDTLAGKETSQSAEAAS